jgi:leader peptidase (prepilin peptidase) / N-methyltransferase
MAPRPCAHEPLADSHWPTVFWKTTQQRQHHLVSHPTLATARAIEPPSLLWHSRRVIPIFCFLFGIVIGSFLNVCIVRIPEGMSIVSPASRCPRCETPIKPHDNIPVLGWFLLKGKCRNCHLPISPMYPLIEFITGALFVVTYYWFGISVLALKVVFFVCLLVVLIVTDLRVRLLPDAINWFGFGVGLAFATRIPPGGFAGIWLRPRHVPAVFTNLLDALLGAILGSMLLLGAATAYRLVRKREGMGMGDVKMMAMVGTFLGVKGTFLTILIGTLMGSIIGLSVVSVLFLIGWQRQLAERAHRRRLGGLTGLRWMLASQYQLPLGSFLGIAAIVVVYAVPWLLRGTSLYLLGVTR